MKGQKTYATQLQKALAEKLPVIPALHRPAMVDVQHQVLPLLPSPTNHYARPIFNTYPETSVLLTTICPGGKR